MPPRFEACLLERVLGVLVTAEHSVRVALVPILLGRGESLWGGLEGLEERFAIESVSAPSGVTHVTFTRRLRSA